MISSAKSDSVGLTLMVRDYRSEHDMLVGSSQIVAHAAEKAHGCGVPHCTVEAFPRPLTPTGLPLNFPTLTRHAS